LMQNGILLVIKLIPIKNDCNASALNEKRIKCGNKSIKRTD